MALRLLPHQPAKELIKNKIRGVLGFPLFDEGQVRGLRPNAHKDPKFANLRRLKVGTSIPLKYMENREQAVRDGFAQGFPNLKKIWRERELFVSCSNSTVDAFVPPDQGAAITEEVKKRWNDIGRFGKDKLAVRKIRGFEPEFNLKVFQDEAKEIYIKAHECLAKNDTEKVGDYVTEHARLTFLEAAHQRTIHWKFLQTLEDPKVVQVRVFKTGEDETSLFSQITVRMFSQQILAVYDRFGRLMYGSEILAKDVLEYIVLEKHLSNEYGSWRIHDKILPNGLTRMAEQTFRAPKEEHEDSTSSVSE